MIAKHGNSGCPPCAGRLEYSLATIPFVLQGPVVVIRDVPAEVCTERNEPFLAGGATDTVTRVLSNLQTLNAEVPLISFPTPSLAMSVDADTVPTVATQTI